MVGDGPDTLLWKAVMIVGVYGCLRRVETTFVEWSNVLLNKAADSFLVSGIMRRKQVGPKRPSTFAITDDVSVNVLKRYMSCFPQSERRGRFFRKLLPNFAGSLPRGSNRTLGINMIGKVPYFIALRLDIPGEDAAKYTGHAFRVTGAAAH